MPTVLHPPPNETDETVEIHYPESDGKPMADNTKQFEWIVTIKENLDLLLPEDFVAGDLFWYPVKGANLVKQAPDVMVAVGRPKGHRGSYKQWEENDIAPQVVFEILSPGNTPTEMYRKEQFYDRHGVEEYYLYDPDADALFGWTRRGGVLLPLADVRGWVSPRLGIRFEPGGQGLTIYRPDGGRFETFAEITQRAAQAEQRASEAERRAEVEHERAEAERRAKEAALAELERFKRMLVGSGAESSDEEQ